MPEQDDSRESPKTVRIEIYTSADGDDEVRIRDVTHVRDLIRFAAQLDERERQVREREERVVAGLRAAPDVDSQPAPAAAVLPVPEPGLEEEDEADLDRMADRFAERSTRDRRLADAEDRLRAGFKELEARESELEARLAVAEADLELREDEIERREQAVTDLERRLDEKETELGAYVARVQGELVRRQPV